MSDYLESTNIKCPYVGMQLRDGKNHRETTVNHLIHFQVYNCPVCNAIAIPTIENPGNLRWTKPYSIIE